MWLKQRLGEWEQAAIGPQRANPFLRVVDAENKHAEPLSIHSLWIKFVLCRIRTQHRFVPFSGISMAFRWCFLVMLLFVGQDLYGPLMMGVELYPWIKQALEKWRSSANPGFQGSLFHRGFHQYHIGINIYTSISITIYINYIYLPAYLSSLSVFSCKTCNISPIHLGPRAPLRRSRPWCAILNLTPTKWESRLGVWSFSMRKSVISWIEARNNMDISSLKVI